MKIGRDFYKVVNDPTVQNKKLTLNFQGKVYEVTLREYLTTEQKTVLFEDAINLFNQDAAEFGLDEETFGPLIFTLLIFKHTTDIEFPESFDEQLEQLTGLIDSNMGKQILENLNPTLVPDLTEFLKVSLEVYKDSIPKQ